MVTQRQPAPTAARRGTPPTRPGWPPSSPRPTRPGPTCCGWGCRPCRTRGSTPRWSNLNGLVARPRSPPTKGQGPPTSSSVPSLGDPQGAFTAVPAQRVGRRDQRPDPRRHPPDPGGRCPPGRRVAELPSRRQLHVQLDAGHRRHRPGAPDRRPARLGAPVGSDQGPGVGRRSPIGLGEDPAAARPADAVDHRLGLAPATAARARSSGSPAATSRSRSSSDPAGHLLVGEVPDHGAELGLRVEAQPVVDPPEALVGIRRGRGRSCGRRCWPPRRRRRRPGARRSRPPSSSRVK